MERRRRPRAARSGQQLTSWPLAGAAALFLLLTIVHTWPLAAQLDGSVLRFGDDMRLNAWIISWLAHAIREGLPIQSPPIFWPQADLIGFNEPLWVPALMGVPLRWLGVSPLTILNVLSLIGLGLTALATHALVVHWTQDHWSGLVAGAVFAFSTDFVGRLAHVQAMHSYALPLALLALAKLFSRGGEKPSAAIWLALSVICAAFTSGYLAVMTVFALGGALVFGAPFLSRPHAATVVRRVALGALITLPVLLVTMRPWWSLSRESIIEAPSIGVKLPQFRGHLSSWRGGGGVHDAENETAVPGGIPTADGRAGSIRT